MIEYAYATEWNDWTGRPTADNRWLSESEARALYERNRPIEVVRVAKRRESDGAVRALWVMGFAGKAGVRVQWLSPKHSVWRLNDYSYIDGRLFRSKTTDYAYPDDERRYDLNESTAMRQLFLRPDGTGGATSDLKSAPVIQRAKVENYRTDNLWLDYPEFGQWEELADFNFGIDSE